MTVTITKTGVVHVDGEPVPKNPVTLRERCLQFLASGNMGVLELMEFVMVERGRMAAGGAFDAALPLVLYFGDQAEREEFIEAVRAERPNMVTRKAL